MSWIELVRNNVAAARKLCDGIPGTRNAILAVWLTIAKADQNTRDLYRGLIEDELEEATQAKGLEDCFPVVGAAPRTTKDKERLVFELAVCLRVLERHFHHINNGAPQRRVASTIAQFGGISAYVLLRNPRHRSAKTGDNFMRRGLKNARLLPARIKEFDVKLSFIQDFRGRRRAASEAALKIGAGLFPGLEFVMNIDGKGFIVSNILLDGQLDTIHEQIRIASADECLGVVYPELTITSSTLQEICANLSDGRWHECDLSMIVAGSCHQLDAGGECFNVCTILDGYGNKVGEHKKLFRYSEGDGPHEAIELGSELEVLVTEQGLFAFGICLDFCNRSESPPYIDLDVDYVIVPSCGGESTMRSHVNTSTDVMKKLRTRTVVVQQFYGDKPDAPGPVGYVLARTDTPEPAFSDLERNQPWNVVVI